MARRVGRWRLERRDWLLAVLVLALLVYADRCRSLFAQIASRRGVVVERMAWAGTVSEIDALLAAPGSDGGEAVSRIDGLVARVERSGAANRNEELAGTLRRSRTALVTGDIPAAREQLYAAVLEIRAGTWAVSRQLGGLFDATAGAAVGGGVFGLASLAALFAALATLRQNTQLSRRSDLIARATSDGCWDWDPATGIAQYSPGWAEITGVQANHVNDWYERVHPDDLPAVMEALNAHLAGKSAYFEAQYRLRDAEGRWRYMLGRGLAEREGGRAVQMAAGQSDITERRAQAALEARSAILAHVSSATGMGFVAVDQAGGVHEVSPSAELVAAPWGSVAAFWSAVSGRLDPAYGACSLCGHPEPVGNQTVDLASPTKGRRFIQVTWTGHAHGLGTSHELSVAIVDDVTSRRTAEDAERLAHQRLVASEAELRGALDTLPSAVVVVADGRVAFSNRTANATFGATPAWQAALLRAAPETRGEPRTVLLDTASGSESFDVFAPEPIRFNGGDAELVMARNASERVRVESQLRAAERLVALGGMAAGLAHEINNPLTYVIGNLELAHEGVGDTGKRIERALDGALRVREVVAQLRDLASPAAPVLESVDPALAFESALALAHGVGLPRARVRRMFVKGLLASGNPVWLGQIALNLVSNALQSMGSIPAGERRLEIGSEEVRGDVRVTVTDSGPGVPDALVASVFDPFVSTRSNGGGTGLGLYICRELCRRMGGKLELVQTGSTGTTFALTLRGAGGLVAERRPRVLVIDAEPGLGEQVRAHLSSHDLRVETTFSGGSLALREPWDAVILEVELPEGSGIDLWLELRERDAEAARRVVFVSGGPITPSVARCMHDSHLPCLVKPFDGGELVRLVEQHLSSHSRHA